MHTTCARNPRCALPVLTWDNRSSSPTHMAAIRYLPHRFGYQVAGRLSVRRAEPKDALEASVGQAIARALRNRLERDEMFWRDSIEGLRRQMARDETTLTYHDLGSGGKPGGASVTRTMADVEASSVPPHQGVALHVLAREIRPDTCLELGTCLGVSSAYLASALDLNENGSLVTLEGGKDLSRVASINFSRLGLKNARFVTGSFADTLPDVLREIGRVDMAYVDGHHDGAATRAYFEQILAHSAERCVMVFDDIRWSRDMREAWRDIVNHPQVTMSLDLLAFGVCVTSASNKSKRA